MGPISQDFVATLAQTLNSSDIPCVLWGHCLLNVHGVPSIIGSIDFVVADEQLQLSIEAITTFAKGVTTCPQSGSCRFNSSSCCTPPPAFHMHVRDALDITLGLYPQSDTLWFLPSLTKTLGSVSKKLPRDSPFMLASDATALPPWRPGRGSGVFTDEKWHPVVIPRPAILLEAFMRLYARDSQKQIGSFAMAMINYVEEYIDEDGFLDATQLPEPLSKFYQQLKSGEMPVRKWTRELKAALDVREASNGS